MLSSEVLDIEIEKTPDRWKKSKVFELYKLANEKIIINEKIVQRAIEVQKSGIKPFDSFHLASAEYSKADIFLTSDKTLLHLARRLDLNVIAANPLNWFMEVDENE
ncbi:MAG: PIN domain-containing protein [Desulfitobacteriaceae bacterium]